MRSAGYLLMAAALAGPSLQVPQTRTPPSVVERLQIQRNASWDGILANIGGSPNSKWEENAPGASPGLVVASPTTEAPE
jgi:hypothetical protein